MVPVTYKLRLALAFWGPCTTEAAGRKRGITPLAGVIKTTRKFNCREDNVWSLGDSLGHVLLFLCLIVNINGESQQSKKYTESLRIQTLQE